jgi:RecA/RadA recombinase
MNNVRHNELEGVLTLAGHDHVGLEQRALEEHVPVIQRLVARRDHPASKQPT